MKRYTIIYSGYIAKNRKHIDYLERLDTVLNQSGFRLLLVNLGQSRIESMCDSVHLPREVFRSKKMWARIKKLQRAVDVSEEMIYAAGIDIDFYDESLESCLSRLESYIAFMEGLFRQKFPCLCVMSIQFTGFHMALKALCQRLSVPFVFQQEGVLPGTICFEPGGQMAESLVSVESDHFRTLTLDKRDLETANRYLDLARRHRLSKKPQTEGVSVHEVLAPIRAQGQKIVFYAGQNDYRSGLWPPWLPESRRHSPFFYNTFDSYCFFFGQVSTSFPSLVMATISSKWADGLLSAVTAVQLSFKTLVLYVPAFTIGSSARTIPT